VDTMSNEFDAIYGCWPERAFIIQNKKIIYASIPQADGTINWENEIIDFLSN